MLPRIKIEYLNGQLGRYAESLDGLMAIVCPADAVLSTFALSKPYPLLKLADLEALGVTEENNALLYKHVVDFYDEASEGTKLVVMGVDKSSKLPDLVDKNKGAVKDLIVGMHGDLRGVFVGLSTDSASSKTEGMDADVFTALPKAQALADWATETLYAPLFVVIEGHDYTGSELKDLSKEAHNRVAVLVGDTKSGSTNAALGLMAGRVASIPVQRNIGRVKDGALAAPQMWLAEKRIDSSLSDVTDLYDKGYICPRNYVGKAGYFYTDDRLACSTTDDYAYLANRRVIDKAYRIAYITLLELMLDELYVNDNGTLQNGVVKSWQQAVENAVNAQMTARGELSPDSKGDGCVCYIDANQNVLATSRIEVTLKVRPFGYARFVDVNLGFKVSK